MGYVSLCCLNLFHILFCLLRMINRTKGGIGKTWEFRVSFASWPVCLADRHGGNVRPAALLPTAAQTGDQSCRPGWAWPVRGGVQGRRDPAGVWLRSNPGDYYHRDAHVHTQQRWYLLLASVPTPVVSPWSEVITCPGILAWCAEIAQLMPDKQPFITFVSAASRSGVFSCVFVFT